MLSSIMDLDKKKKMEELRKRLQSLPEEEFKKLLDTSDDKPQHQWDTSMRQKGVIQPQFFTPQAREKFLNNLAQNTPQWRESRSKYMTGRPNPEHSKRMSKEGNANYGKGYTYIELTTGFKGTATEVAEKFNISRANVGSYAKRDRPMKSGICKGKHFRILEGVKRKTKVATIKYKEISTNTTGTLDELSKIFDIASGRICSYAKWDRPIKKGKFKGLQFKKL